ncbi:hypothetical protein H8N00_13630 [Streptomyces sp. AC563]|uniref:hypothetical protein n=1 Tax=Streptomyces buecherae TaxID=2763006 RepID=UPI00164D0C94|nr:hypothetical protein [Streptomyces buecherae]MBC3989898.1 hypothetical protein [Streptomyces buecherae]
MDRWDRAGRVAAYGAALALTPYVLIKVSWVVGSLVGLLPVGTGFGMAEWVVLNSATIAMAGIGIAVALALVRPWGMRIPGAPLAFCAWVGAGFLVPVLPYAVLSSLLGSDGGPKSGDDADPSMPVWEAVLIQIGFVGMGLGLAIALPAYVRRRWPDVFAGRLGDRGERAPGALPWMAVVGAAVGLVWLYWAVGGTLGVAHRDERGTAWYALAATFGLWALAASLATWATVRGRPARLPRWVPMALGWLGSGSLFAWSGWKLPFTLYLAIARPADASLPENLAVAVVLHLAAVGAGAAMLRALVRTRTKPSRSWSTISPVRRSAN